MGMTMQVHPTWVRGLKINIASALDILFSVAPYMGAWIEIRNIHSTAASGAVAPYMGAWIEILSFS